MNREIMIVIGKHTLPLTERNLRRMMRAERAVIKQKDGTIIFKHKRGQHVDIDGLLLKFL